MWWGVSFSVPELEKQERHYIRTKLSAYRFVPYHPGFWIRPLYKGDKFEQRLDSVFSNKHCLAIRFEFVHPLSRKEVSKLWNLNAINSGFKKCLALVKNSRKRIPLLQPEKVFIEKIYTGNDIVRVLFKDPLLPDAYLPDDWAAGKLKTEFALWYADIQKFSKPFLDKAIHGGC